MDYLVYTYMHHLNHDTLLYTCLSNPLIRESDYPDDV